MSGLCIVMGGSVTNQEMEAEELKKGFSKRKARMASEPRGDRICAP